MLARKGRINRNFSYVCTYNYIKLGNCVSDFQAVGNMSHSECICTFFIKAMLKEITT